ncbi:flagellar biosynthetic protein FliO [Demequina aestuarii]|uniref:flagellar biosynthetic protein FliO n=1 Tax=Demequina aestuarii TaxID=327095 RepID=UPI0007852787|nr:flagellar biosynthetic protein FliO [Demequina aestuarii]
MDTVLLMLRVGLSLAAVLALLWWISRRVQAGMGDRRSQQAMSVVGRQQLTRRTGLALVEVGGRQLVVGYSEQGVSLVHDVGECPVEPESTAAAPHSTVPKDDSTIVADDLLPMTGSSARTSALDPAHVVTARTAAAPRLRTPLDGSILAPDTWRKAVVAVQERTTRRS